METEIPYIRLNNGLQMPVFGLSISQNTLGQIVKQAIDIGYRLFDCTQLFNEKPFGDAVQEKICEKVIKREDLFLISKLRCDSYHPDSVESALSSTLNNLQTGYIDLYLIDSFVQSPESKELNSTNSGEYLYDAGVGYAYLWNVMETLYRKKVAKAIGLCNFSNQQIGEVLNICSVFPHVNKVEYHPSFNQRKLRQLCEQHGVILISYFCFDDVQKSVKLGDLDILSDSRLEEIAKRYGKTPTQIFLKYNLQLGNVVIPEISTENKIAEIINIFDFYLAPEDMSYIRSFYYN